MHQRSSSSTLHALKIKHEPLLAHASSQASEMSIRNFDRKHTEGMLSSNGRSEDSEVRETRNFIKEKLNILRLMKEGTQTV